MVWKAKLMKQETFECEIRLQDDPDRASPGRLTGILMPYETRASDRNELFELNSLSWPDDGVLVRRMHQRGAPIVKAVPFVEGSALRLDAALPNSPPQAGTPPKNYVQESCKDFLSNLPR